jgi:hypothetical protein
LKASDERGRPPLGFQVSPLAFSCDVDQVSPLAWACDVNKGAIPVDVVNAEECEV